MLKFASHEFVRSVVMHDRNWRWISEYGQEKDEYDTSINSIYLAHEDMGYAEFKPISRVMWEGHIAMLPGATGTVEFGKECLEYMHFIGARKIVASISSNNKAAKRYLEKLGFIREGYLKDCLVSEKGMSDIMIYGLNLCQA